MVLDELDRPFRLTLAATGFVLSATISGMAVNVILGASLLGMGLGVAAPFLIAFVVGLAIPRRSRQAPATADHLGGSTRAI